MKTDHSNIFRIVEGLRVIMKDSKLCLSHDGSSVGVTNGYEFVSIEVPGHLQNDINTKIRILNLKYLSTSSGGYAKYYMTNNYLELSYLDNYYTFHHGIVMQYIEEMITTALALSGYDKRDFICHFKPIRLRVVNLIIEFPAFEISTYFILLNSDFFSEVHAFEHKDGFIKNIGYNIYYILGKSYKMFSEKIDKSAAIMGNTKCLITLNF